MQRLARPLSFHIPMECRAADQLPDGEDWQYELKLDGYRVQAIKNRGEVRLYSRNGKPFEDRFAEVAEAVRHLRAEEFILDGEIVALDAKGGHSFAALQRSRSKKTALRFYAFDLLALDGKDLMKLPLRRRRELLEAKVPMPVDSIVQRGPVFKGDVQHILTKIAEFGFEGVVAKRLDSPYVPGEAPGTWLKHKTQQSADFVVGGFIANGASVAEIVVGEMVKGRLVFVESVRAGFVPATRRKAFALLKGLRTDTCLFTNLPEKRGVGRMDREKMADITWTRPEAVAEIAFNERTAGHLRHPSFLRFRDPEDRRR